MVESFDEIRSKAEELDWKVTDDSEHACVKGEVFFEFGKESPAGEDFFFTASGKTPEEMIEDIQSYVADFDQEEHVISFLDAKKNGFSGVPSIRELLNDAEEIERMLRQLVEVLVYGQSLESDFADETFAETKWYAADVIGVAKEKGVEMTEEQAAQWWEKNQLWFKNQLVERGNEMLADVNWTNLNG